MRHMIAERAYYIAQEQNFALGQEMENWLQAEAEMLSQSLSQQAPVKRSTATRKTTAKPIAEGEAPVATAPRKRTRKVTA